MKLTEKHIEWLGDETGDLNARTFRLKWTHCLLTFTGENQNQRGENKFEHPPPQGEKMGKTENWLEPHQAICYGVSS